MFVCIEYQPNSHVLLWFHRHSVGEYQYYNYYFHIQTKRQQHDGKSNKQLFFLEDKTGDFLQELADFSEIWSQEQFKWALFRIAQTTLHILGQKNQKIMML
jgi:hypothetical protein